MITEYADLKHRKHETLYLKPYDQKPDDNLTEHDL
jgi:hypothetical protein